MPLPDLLTIARQPFPDGSGQEMKKVLLLLLGCAVQSNKKEEFVKKIKELDISLQQAIVEQIRRVTNDADCVLNVQALELDPEDKATTVVLHQLQRVVKERDQYAQTILEMGQDQESDCSSTQSVCNGDACARKLPECQQYVNSTAMDSRESPVENLQHASMEMTEIRAKLRKIRQELDEKTEQLLSYREEIEEKERKILSLSEENLELKQLARQAKEFRDDYDILREKAAQLERLEVDCAKYKEKMIEAEFMKSRTNELREENGVLWEKRHELENELENMRSKLRDTNALEIELAQCQRKLANHESQLEIERRKLNECLDENCKLKQECQDSLNKSNILEKEIDTLKSGPSPNSSTPNSPHFLKIPLSDQLQDSVQCKLLKLESENDRLRQKLLLDSDSIELKQENDRLRKRCEHLAESLGLAEKSCNEIKIEKESILQRLKAYEMDLETNSENYGSRIEQISSDLRKLEVENSDLKSASSDARADCRKLKIDLDLANSKFSELDAAKRQISLENRNLGSELFKLKSELCDEKKLRRQLESEKFELERRAEDNREESDAMQKKIGELSRLLDEKQRCLDEMDEKMKKMTTRFSEMEKYAENVTALQRQLDESRKCIHLIKTELETNGRKVEEERILWSKKETDLETQLANFESVNSRILSTLVYINAPCATNDLSRFDQLIRHHIDKLQSECNRYQTQLQRAESDLSELSSQLKNKSGSSPQLQQASSREESLLKTNRNLTDKNSMLQTDIKTVRQQVCILEEQIRKMQILIDTGAQEKAVLRKEIGDLQTHIEALNLELENEKRLCSTQSVKVDESQHQNDELAERCRRISDELATTLKRYASLTRDHDRLRVLHERLSVDCDAAHRESIRAQEEARSARREAVAARERLARAEMEIARFHETLERDRLQDDQGAAARVALQDELGACRRDLLDARARLEQSDAERRACRAEFAAARTDRATLATRLAQAQRHAAECQQTAQRKDLELVKALHKCDMLSQLNGTLEEESRTLLRQMEHLITQNQELLTQALIDQRQYHADEKELQEKLNALKRHKEKLEEKIMEQYKAMDSPKKHKEKSNFIKKARAALTVKPCAKKSPLSAENTLECRSQTTTMTSCEQNSYSDADGIYEKKCSNRAVSVDRLTFLRRHEDQEYCSYQSYASSDNDVLKDGVSPYHSANLKINKPRSNSVTAVRSSLSLPASEKISLAGSERGVDVPSDPGDSPFDSATVNLSSTAPAKPPPPPYVPPRQTIAASSLAPPPPRLPRTNPSASSRHLPLERHAGDLRFATDDDSSRLPIERRRTPILTRYSSMRQPRPPPPPYLTGKIRHAVDATPASCEASGTSICRRTPSDAETQLPFLPQKTSTPNAKLAPRAVAQNADNDVIVQLDIDSLKFYRSNDVSSMSTTAPSIDSASSDDAGPRSKNETCQKNTVISSSNNKNLESKAETANRKEVLSFYENMSIGAPLDEQSNSRTSASNVATSDAIMNETNSNMIWYEYGCV